MTRASCSTLVVVVVQQVLRKSLTSYLAVQPISWIAERALELVTTCGDLYHGTAVLQCLGCGDELEVTYSCKRVTLCSRCGYRRMYERTHHLMNAVIPCVPVRHWVLNLPPHLRFNVGYYHHILAGLLRIFVRAIFMFLRRHAKVVLRLSSTNLAHPAGISVIHRVSARLTANFHFHCVIVDGVWIQPRLHGPVEFHALPPPTDAELAKIASRVCKQTRKLLMRHHAWQDVLVQTSPDTVSGFITLRDHQLVKHYGAAAMPYQQQPRRPDGAQPYEVYTSHRIEGTDRENLKRLLFYLLSPPITDDQLEVIDDQHVRVRYKRETHDGVAEEIITHHDLIDRLVPLVSLPRSHLLHYHGAFSPSARIRKLVVPDRKRVPRAPQQHMDDSQAGHEARKAMYLRVHHEDIATCRRCGGRLQLVLLIGRGVHYRNPHWIKPDIPADPAVKPDSTELKVTLTN